MKKMILLGCLFVLSACASSDAQIGEYLKKHPQAVFDVIEQNPEAFIEVVNKAARKAQENAQEKQNAETRKQQEEQIKNPLKPQIEDSRRLIGTKDAKITIVEYADFQCPACAMAHVRLKQFIEKHAGEVQFFYKNMPLDFHPMAEPAARYFEALMKQDKAKAKKFYDHVFENQREMKNEEFLVQAAKKVGANMQRLAQDAKSSEVRKLIEADMSEFEKMGFTGTPVIVINGVSLYGAQPIEELEKVLALTTQR